jgi:hypothetical protein
MKTKRTLPIATVLIALAVLAMLEISRDTRHVHAQVVPPPTPGRVSFGMVGITQGQTVRVTAVNGTLPNDVIYPPGPTRVVLTLLDADGQLLRNRSGLPISRVVMLERGRSAFLDFDFDDYPPGLSRLQLRAVVDLLPPAPTDNEIPPPIGGRIVASLEVFNNANGRTVVYTGNPNVVYAGNPDLGL